MAQTFPDEEKGISRVSQGNSTANAANLELGAEKEKGAESNGILAEPSPKIAAQSAPSVVSPTLEIVPRSQRRGLFGILAIIPEVKNPRNYSRGTKWVMTVIVAFAAITSSTGSSIFYPALSEVAKDLNTTETVTNLSLAFYMLAMSFTPLWWSAYSELLGRRTIYLMSFLLFVIFSVCSAVSVNIAMLIVMRVLSGGAAASVQAVGAGTVADLWEPKERGRAMGIFYVGPLCGPGISPIIGGALTQGLGWRSTLWFLTIFGGVMLILIIFCLPETLPQPKTLGPQLKSEEKKRSCTIQSIIKEVFGPLKVLALLRYPPVLIAVYSAAVAFGALFVTNVSIQSNFGSLPYNFSVIVVGLMYIPPTIGYAVSSVLGGRWIDYIMKREARKAGRVDEDGKPKYLPEDRMKENIWIAATVYPAALIWYGWSVDKDLHWIVPCIANVFFGLGCMLVFGAVTTMVTEFTPKRASSGVAVNNFTRNIFSCIAAVVVQPLINSMGTGWMCTMVGLFAWVTGNAAIYSLKKWGPQWRVAMDKRLNA
ncbi:MFS antiporter QDR3 [Coleophoma crateriformis]|uniref:MFS antiporter QDR3 n=1 Tax=Coleophoma crateriformis TaxID=565419 RepID=A0A3D8Q5J9_9HELO|nr:MFS antiporter QDR3 [Coleophoma crateriformis]